MKFIKIVFLMFGFCFGLAQVQTASAHSIYQNHAARLTIGAGVGLAHGLFNKWLACRTGFTKQNPLLYRAPLGEWLSAVMLVVLAGRAVGKLRSNPEYQCQSNCNRLMFGPLFLQLAIQGLAQGVGETVPMSKSVGRRDVAVNMQLLLASGYGLCWLVEKCGLLGLAARYFNLNIHTHSW